MELSRKVRQVWITYSARFNAAARLRRRAAYETWLVPILSVVILTLNVAQLMDFMATRETEIVIFTIFGSLLTTVVGLIWRPADSLAQSKRMDECALEMKAHSIFLEQAAERPTTDEFIRAYSAYNDIETKFNLNHDTLDHERVVIWKEEKKWVFLKKLWFQTRYYFRYHFGYQLIVAVAVVLALWIMFRP